MNDNDNIIICVIHHDHHPLTERTWYRGCSWLEQKPCGRSSCNYVRVARTSVGQCIGLRQIGRTLENISKGVGKNSDNCHGRKLWSCRRARSRQEDNPCVRFKLGNRPCSFCFLLLHLEQEACNTTQNMQAIYTKAIKRSETDGDDMVCQ